MAQSAFNNHKSLVILIEHNVFLKLERIYLKSKYGSHPIEIGRFIFVIKPVAQKEIRKLTSNKKVEKDVMAKLLFSLKQLKRSPKPEKDFKTEVEF